MISFFTSVYWWDAYWCIDFVVWFFVYGGFVVGSCDSVVEVEICLFVGSVWCIVFFVWFVGVVIWVVWWWFFLSIEGVVGF